MKNVNNYFKEQTVKLSSCRAAIILSISILFLQGNSVYAQRVDLVKLKKFVQRAEETHSEAMIIYQNGKLVTEKYFGLGQPGKLIETMSATKSIVGLAMACILTDKLIDSLDVPVYHFYPEWKQGTKQFITIRHLVNMTSGLQNVRRADIEIYPSRDFVKLALAAELSTPPGEKFDYNNKALNLISGIVEQITHQRMDKYIGERLFKELDITHFTWSLDTAGNPQVMAGCQIAPKDFVKIGMLMLGKGMYQGKKIISDSAFSELIKPVNQYKGYAMLWWLDYSSVISVIDDEILEKLRNSNLPRNFVDQVSSLRGTYGTQEEYLKALKKTFGEHATDTVQKYALPLSLPIRKRNNQDVIYRADGYLGNYIIIDPKKRLVAIRMISHDSYKVEDDSFSEFIHISKLIF